MERLIDVNKVIDSMQKCLDESPDKRHSVAYFAFESIIELLKKEPTVDAVEVVRCRDCKKYRKPFCLLDDNQSGYLTAVPPEHYCSYGKRKDGDGNG